MEPAITYLLLERLDFRFQTRYEYETISTTTIVDEAIAWANSGAWRMFSVKENDEFYIDAH
jgi:hypothetical protein